MVNFTIRGEGVIDGNGFMWWQREYVSLNKHGRPHMLLAKRISGLEMTGVKWQNSPMFHLNI